MDKLLQTKFSKEMIRIKFYLQDLNSIVYFEWSLEKLNTNNEGKQAFFVAHDFLFFSSFPIENEWKEISKALHSLSLFSPSFKKGFVKNLNNLSAKNTTKTTFLSISHVNMTWKEAYSQIRRREWKGIKSRYSKEERMAT